MISASSPDAQRLAWNRPRDVAGATGGHYESWFQRANHPTRPLAFWIRYTMFRPQGRPQDAVGELWAIFFDGERGRVAGVKESVPMRDCRFSPEGMDIRIGSAVLTEAGLEGAASSRSHRLQWTLGYDCNEAPLLLLPRALYERSFPKAKALVGSPNAVFRGTIVVDGQSVAIQEWKGSQNHNWGSQHTDSYAWGQVAGFEEAPDAFLECSTAQVRIGPLWTPRMSLVVLRAGGREYALNSLGQALRSRGKFEFFDWRIRAVSADASISVHVHAPRSLFVGLTYDNPPGGTKTCLNTKLAACEVTLETPTHPLRTYTTLHRAAFEILTDRDDHGVEVVS